jgi:hypothetical protein
MGSIKRHFFSSVAGMMVVLALVQVLYAGGSSAHAAATQSITKQTSYKFYGSNYSWMYTATGDWYQQQGNWCGIASIRAIQRYDWLYYDGKSPQWDNSQSAIHNRLNSYSSPWGSGGGYVFSDISRDFGTDPHSVAYGAWYDTPPSTQSQPYWFHNWIYRTSAKTATYDFGTDFGTNTVSHNDPITVMIDAGYHSFVIDGVYATSDPSLPGTTIGSIDTWDPWLNHANNSRDGTHPYNSTEQEVWSLSDWTSLSKLWGQGYGNSSDPEPDTSNHYYVPPFPSYGVAHHWNTYFVTIEQDRINNDSTSFDYAIDQNGYLAPHN